MLFSNTIIGCHKGTCSATPLAQNEKSLNSAIANQTQGQVGVKVASLL
ncbi:Methyl-accepting chemotaxis protein (plasmid) [Nostoc flagelliforme CCNUN1]|uniref:Methyl-accepting chemotaxis protein n=1 Tax=Nostoc flagelliforme CCNUN1 TaxID=2038116 RepID=A0A2K8T6I1_9NOSO|nr:Methyl-accepting chemotaxis protein [Nostoc flagelliforme CCNUN1]